MGLDEIVWKKKIIVPIQSIPTRNRDFQTNSQNGTGGAENVSNKKFSFWSIPTRPGIGNSRKIAKKFKKLKNINMASFQAKTGRERLRTWEKKNSRSDPFQTDPE